MYHLYGELLDERISIIGFLQFDHTVLLEYFADEKIFANEPKEQKIYSF